MRTTVTLDPDVVAALRRAARERGTSVKEVLNDAPIPPTATPPYSASCSPRSAPRAI